MRILRVLVVAAALLALGYLFTAQQENDASVHPFVGPSGEPSIVGPSEPPPL